MKDGNWIPVDKRILSLFATDRPYTEAEAYLSLRIDLDNDAPKKLREYARIWKWSRGKVQRFFKQIDYKTGEPLTVTKARQSRDKSETPIRIVFNSLDSEEKTKARQSRDKSETVASHNYNTNTNTELNNVIGKTDLTPVELARKFFDAWRNPKIRGEKFKEYSNRLGDELDGFCKYWTERTKSGKKERWETEKTWELPRRIGTWMSNKEKRESNGRFQEEPQPKIEYFK